MESEAFLKLISSGDYIDERYKVLVIASHPDDEVIGTGSLFSRIKNLSFVHTTDGAPANYTYSDDSGSYSGKEYSELRFMEFDKVLSLTQTNPRHHFRLGFGDQTLSHNMTSLTRRLVKIILFAAPDFIFLNPFEGGHPDHDATAFAVHSAASILNAEGFKINLLEYALYFNNNGMIQTGEFMDKRSQVHKLLLNPAEQKIKQEMYNCFYSQRETIKYFHTLHEVFRSAPAYDFLHLPSTATLYYDFFNWGINSVAWFRKAYQSLTEINVFRQYGIKDLYYEYT